MNFGFVARTILILSGFCTGHFSAIAEPAKTEAKKVEKPGSLLEVPPDGLPWRHLETGIVFPQKLGDFVLHTLFRDKRDDAGIALTYVLPNSNLRADVVLYPCKEKEIIPAKVEKIVRTEHEHLVTDIVAVAVKQGYAERNRSELVFNAIQLFKKGALPLTTQTLDLVSANGDPTGKPPLNQWIGLSLYADYFVQMNVLLPATKDAKKEEAEKTAKQVDEVITMLIHCVKEPIVVPEMLKLCGKYMDHPIDEEGRNAADALLLFSKASPIFEIALPGEVITPALDEVGQRSADTSLDLLRAFVVGSSVVSLQNGTVDQSLAEGSRVLGEVRELLRTKGVNVDSKLLDELQAASKEGKAAEFIRARIKNPTPPAK